MKRYYDLFLRDQIKVYLFEELENNPVNLLQDIFRFLEVEYSFIPDTSMKYNMTIIKKNKTSLVRSIIDFSLLPQGLTKSFLRLSIPARALTYLTPKSQRICYTKPALSNELREKLIQDFREDILKLQDLIKKDLSSWLDNEVCN